MSIFYLSGSLFSLLAFLSFLVFTIGFSSNWSTVDSSLTRSTPISTFLRASRHRYCVSSPHLLGISIHMLITHNHRHPNSHSSHPDPNYHTSCPSRYRLRQRHLPVASLHPRPRRRRSPPGLHSPDRSSSWGCLPLRLGRDISLTPPTAAVTPACRLLAAATAQPGAHHVAAAGQDNHTALVHTVYAQQQEAAEPAVGTAPPPAFGTAHRGPAAATVRAAHLLPAHAVSTFTGPVHPRHGERQRRKQPRRHR